MEKHKCKLCFRNFSNGRALGGHMRSHMMNLAVPPKPQVSPPPTIQLSFEAESASSSSSEEGGEDKGLGYERTESPKRSIHLVDPEFTFAAADTGSVILQDRESETESSKNRTRRRSKRAWNKLSALDHQYNHHKKNQELESMKKLKTFSEPGKTESWVEPEPVSSVSDTTTEEDVAFCLMMMSRDKWKKQKKDQEEFHEEEVQYCEEDEEEEEEDEISLEDSDESEELKSSKEKVRGRYKCETCKKTFRSYQALGGHRASHKKIKVTTTRMVEPELEHDNNNGGTSSSIADKKIHECPVCFRVFASGQALGGHKRTHVIGSGSATATEETIPVRISSTESLIDLNLPAPMDDDDISQIENSAVSDAEFANPIRK